MLSFLESCEVPLPKPEGNRFLNLGGIKNSVRDYEKPSVGAVGNSYAPRLRTSRDTCPQTFSPVSRRPKIQKNGKIQKFQPARNLAEDRQTNHPGPIHSPFEA
jgi:hypothetical protein